jgi:hypothetical protein
MARTKALSKSSVTEYTEESGEVKNQITTDQFSVEAEPPFVKLYLDDIARLNSLSKSMNATLKAIVKYMNFRNEIILVAHNKRQIAEELGIGFETVEKAIKALKAKGLIMSAERSCYVVDPLLFGKGRWKEIKNLRLTIEYTNSGKVLSSSAAPKPTQQNLFDAPIVEEGK